MCWFPDKDRFLRLTVFHSVLLKKTIIDRCISLIYLCVPFFHAVWSVHLSICVFTILFKCWLKGLFNHFCQISDSFKLWHLGQSDSKQKKDTSPSAETSISSLSQWCPFAVPLLALVFLFYMISLCQRAVCHFRVQKASNCHQSVAGNSQKLLSGLCLRHTRLPGALCVSLSLSE